MAWGAPVVSVIATIGFFVTAWLATTSHTMDTPMGNLIMGGMLTGYSTVLAYWLGSSSAARRNGDAVRAIATAAAPRLSAPHLAAGRRR